MNLQRDAARLATIATIFVWVGWLFVLYALIAGILWWIDLAGRDGVQLPRGLRDLGCGHRRRHSSWP